MGDITVPVNAPAPRGITGLWQHRSLIRQLTRRSIEVRYRGSALGIVWALITPLFLLAIYTFMFVGIFGATWPGIEGWAIAMAIFCGLIVYNVFSETLSVAPTLIVQNTNYVKKTVFPTEVLPIATLFTAVYHSLFSLAVLIGGVWITEGTLHWTIVFVPLIYVPLLGITLGLAWILASIGVFLRDIGNLIGLLLTATLFLTPVFYSLDMWSEELRVYAYLNPLTGIVEALRAVVVFGRPPDPTVFALLCVAAAAILGLGHTWFMRTKNAFADVL